MIVRGDEAQQALNTGLMALGSDLSWTMFGKKGVENKLASLIPLGKFCLTRICVNASLKFPENQRAGFR